MTKYPRPGNRKATEIYSSYFESLDNSETLEDSVSGAGLASYSVCRHRVEEVHKLFGIPFVRPGIPFMRTSPRWSNHFSTALPSDTSPWN